MNPLQQLHSDFTERVLKSVALHGSDKAIKQGDEIYYAGSFYTVAEIKDFPHGKMIGIYDQPGTSHIDYLQPRSVKEVYRCYACQGGGCPVCQGYGKIVGN